VVQAVAGSSPVSHPSKDLLIESFEQRTAVAGRRRATTELPIPPGAGV
jgi:hypothetical protein